MTDVLNIEPKRWDWRAGTGVTQTVRFTLTDGDGDPITGSTFEVVAGGDATDVEPVTGDDLTTWTGVEGDPGVYDVDITPDTPGAHRLRTVLDDKVTTVGLIYVGSGGNEGDVSLSQTFAVGDVNVALTVIGGGGTVGGGGTWGSITGTLSEQTDLQDALDLKANAGDLATVASTGSYNDLTDTPVAPGAPDWGEIGGTLSDQTDLNNALAAKADTSSLGTAAAADTGDFATAAQGSLADSAVQPGDLGAVATTNDYGDLDNLPSLGTAAAAATGDFATAAQGSTADSAVQPGDLATVATTGAYSDLTGTPTLGTAAAQDVGDFATGAEGDLAASAVQPGDLGTIATHAEEDYPAYDAVDDLSLTAPTYPGDGTVEGGVVRQATSVQVQQSFTSAIDPTDPAIGTGLLIDVDATITDGGGAQPNGPQFGTHLWGPRGVVNLEGAVRYGRDQALFSISPISYATMLAVANTDSVARTIRPSWGYLNAPFTTAQGATVTLAQNDTALGAGAFADHSVLVSTDGGDMVGATYEHTSFHTRPGFFGDITIDKRIGLDVQGVITGLSAFVNGGEMFYGLGTIDADDITIGTEIGVRIANFTLAGTSIGVLSEPPIIGESGYFGGDGSGDAVTIGSTTHATRGVINLRDKVKFLTEDTTNTSSAAGIVAMEVESARTYTLADAGGGLRLGNSFAAFIAAPTLLFEEDGSLFGSSLFSASPVMRNATGEARTNPNYITLASGVFVTGVGASGSITLTAGAAVQDTINVSGNTGGTGTVTAWAAVKSTASPGTSGTITTRRGLWYQDATGAGTLTTQYAIDIEALSKGTTNVGIRNASTHVNTPSVQTLSATGNSITANATVKRLNNTSGGSLTLTSTPTIANGQDGQMLVLINTSANNVVLQDEAVLAGSNLRLPGGANLTLGQRDVVTLHYSSTLGDWVAVSTSNN